MMEITEVRIKLMEESNDRLQAFCSITFDNCFVVRDLKIIEGANGPFVAMPSRKLTFHCPQCGCKNHLRSAYCNQCGVRLKEPRELKDATGRTKLYADIAHPINSQCREMIQQRVIEAYRAELERAKKPGYVSHYDEEFAADAGPEGDEGQAPFKQQAPAADETHLEPPQPAPRPPHKRPARRRQRDASPPPRRPNDDFGAGLF